MPLNFVVETLDGLEEPIANLYAKGDDEKFYLEVEGAVSSDQHKAKIAEFRDKNIELMKSAEKYKDIDLENYKGNMKKAQLYDEVKGKTVSPEQVDKMVNERVAKMREEHDTELAARDEKILTQGRQLETLVIDTKVRTAATERGIRPEAMEDVLLRAKSIFKVEDGVAVPYDGDDVVYGRDGSKPMSTGEWIDGLRKKAGHLFAPNKGGGARPSSGPGGPSRENMSPLAKIKAGLGG